MKLWFPASKFTSDQLAGNMRLIIENHQLAMMLFADDVSPARSIAEVVVPMNWSAPFLLIV